MAIHIEPDKYFGYRVQMQGLSGKDDTFLMLTAAPQEGIFFVERRC